MGWFRMDNGHLIHAEGSHAAVCVASGWAQVADDEAVDEASRYEAARIEAAAEAKAAADAPVPVPVLEVDFKPYATLTDDELEDVARALADEAPTIREK